MMESDHSQQHQHQLHPNFRMDSLNLKPGLGAAPTPPQPPVIPIPKVLQKEGTYRLIKSCSTNLICAICFGINARACKGCYNVAYCCREHQMQHWAVHQASCRMLVNLQKEEVLRNLSLPLEERSFDPYTGMYKAARNLKENETILEIQPVMHVPHNKGLPVPPDSILCLGCNRWYQLSRGYRCGNCKWPVCCEKCETDSCHSLYECRVFADNKILPPTNPSLYDGDHILAIRCALLKKLKPTDWEKLVALEPIVEQVVRPRHCLESDEKTARFLVFNCNLKESTGISMEGAMRLLKVIDFCSVWLPERSAFMRDKHISFVR